MGGALQTAADADANAHGYCDPDYHSDADTDAFFDEHSGALQDQVHVPRQRR
jgi:hypothetical protein